MAESIEVPKSIVLATDVPLPPAVDPGSACDPGYSRRQLNDWATEHLEEFLACTRTVARLIQDLSNLSDLTVELALRELGSTRGSLMLECERHLLRIQAARGLPREIVETTTVEIGRGIAGRVAALGRPLLVQTLRHAPADLIGVGKYETDSYISVPLLGEHQILGVVNVTERLEDEPFHKGDVERLIHISQSMGMAIQRSMLYRQAEELAVRDDLTALYNRRYLRQFLDAILEQAQNEGFPVTLLVFDLDNFKSYNDQYGHPAGDQLLWEVAELMRWNFRSHDVIARLGGEEFAVVLSDGRGEKTSAWWQGHPSQPLLFAERLRRATMRHHFTAIGRAGVTLSGGLASFPWDALSREELIEQADKALYRAKRDGRNRVYLSGRKDDLQNEQ